MDGSSGIGLMWDRLSNGYRLALATLAVELLLCPGLLFDASGIFTLMAMPFIGIAWAPAALMIVSDLRPGNSAHPAGYAVAGICGLAGLGCLYVVARWALAGALAA